VVARWIAKGLLSLEKRVSLEIRETTIVVQRTPMQTSSFRKNMQVQFLPSALGFLAIDILKIAMLFIN
tara:strand:- start:335 stop:538 length:204 start_codon:yes stop_codon:yes gene_type:complete